MLMIFSGILVFGGGGGFLGVGVGVGAGGAGWWLGVSDGDQDAQL